LLRLGLAEPLVSVICEVYNANRRRLLLLRGSLGISAPSYRDLSWRLEMELARRNQQAVAAPRYLLRLDLINNAQRAQGCVEGGIGIGGSVHLQAGLPAMRLLEAELQIAMDEVNNVHCQRIHRYIA